MQKYTASNPITGNSSYSFVDQEEADLRLKYLDDNGCNNCTDCYNCKNCNHCKNCTDCTDCYNCKNCTDCNNCNNCKNCYDCNNCYNCKNCTDCYNCKNCYNIQSSQDYLILGPAQSSSRMTYSYIDSELKALVISCGCFNGSLAEFKYSISRTHKDSPIYLAQYNAFAACIEASLSHRIPK